MRREQRELERGLMARQASPVQQAMAIEGVPDAAVGAAVHGETKSCGAGVDEIAGTARTFRVGAIFSGDMFADIFPGTRHVGVELERLETDVRAHDIGSVGKRLFERFEPDDTPRANHITDKINPHGFHGQAPLHGMQGLGPCPAEHVTADRSPRQTALHSDW